VPGEEGWSTRPLAAHRRHACSSAPRSRRNPEALIRKELSALRGLRLAVQAGEEVRRQFGALVAAITRFIEMSKEAIYSSQLAACGRHTLGLGALALQLGW
jgi:hypothetical protein